MESNSTGEGSQTEPGMVREARDTCTDNEKKGRRLSRKKSKNRSRKRRSHSKGVSDGEADTVAADDMTEGSRERLGRQNSIPSRQQKSRSLSGSRKRLSSWFKRKSRSESRGRSKSETELSKVDQSVVNKRHESAEDIKRGSRAKSYHDSPDNKLSGNHNSINDIKDRGPDKDINYEKYDITKKPRDRLRRMTVRDAVKERRLRKASSGQSQLERYIDTEDVREGRTRTASLPDITNPEPQCAETQDQDGHNKDVIDSASPYVRGSVTLPRDKKNRLKKKKNSTKKGRVSIEADSDDNIIDDTVTQSSARLQNCERLGKNGNCERESPHSQIEVMVHGNSNLPDKDIPKGDSGEQSVSGDIKLVSEHPEQSCQNESTNKDTYLQDKPDKPKPVPKQNVNTKAETRKVSVSPLSSKAVSRWQSAIQDVQKQRRKQSLSLFLELSRSPNPYSSRSASPSHLLLDKSRSVSPRGRAASKDKITERAKTLSPLREGGKSTLDVPKDSLKSKQECTLGVPHQLDRSLSDGEGRAVLETTEKSAQKCHRSASSKSEPSKKGSPQNGERNGVPVMGTSVQQKYKRTFSPKRQEKVPKENAERKGDETKDCMETNVYEIFHKPESDNQGSQNEKRETDGNSEVLSVDKDDDANKSDLCKALETRGRESQRRRARSARSFRRKREKEEEAVKENEKNKEETDMDKKPTSSPVRIMYDKGTQTSEIDLTEKTKLFGKNKKNNKKDKKNKAKDKKKIKEVTSLVHEHHTEEEKKLCQADDILDNKVSEEKVIPDDKDDYSKPCNVSDTYPDTPTENTTKDNKEESKPKPKKLSFATLVLLKSRLASRRKKRELESKKESGKDSFKDMFLIENEINLSKLAEIKETDILDDEIVEPDVSIELPRKQIRFEPIASDEPIQGEEPLPPLTRRSKRMDGRRDSRMREKRRKCLQCCKKFTAFLFSHIGLCSLVVAYTIMGGFIFKAIEGPFEEKVKTIIKQKRIEMVDKLLQHATELKLSEIGHENFTAVVDQHLKDFQKTVFKETKEHGWDGKDKTDSEVPEMQWSFASSLLYAITVMTTIGYGHVAPKTNQGRIVTIGYAVLGIPLTLLCLTNIGDVMATGFRLLYGKVCCGVCCKLFSPRRRRIPDLEKGLAHQVMASEEEEADKPKEVIRVPTSLCILLIAGYIFAGALLFALWEKWDYLTGSYFCFITLSTIGFGDIVPGTDLNAWSQQEKLVLCAMYLLFGLSLIAMCFNLVQEDVKAKCRWLGMKMGIIDKPESGV